MNKYQKAIKYTKPLTEIDEKINRLNEMMTTTGLYVTGQQIDAQLPVEPTFGETPDASLGDFSDLNSFTQNADNDNVDQLSANDAGGTSVPITDVMDTSSFDFASGVSALAMARHGRTETGVVYGFIDSQNVFNEIFSIGGLRPSGRGESDIIDAGLDWWGANVEGKTIETVGWKCYNVPRLQDLTYPPLEENVGPGGNYMLHSNSLLFVKNQNFMTDAGNPHRPARFDVLTRDDLGDVNFLSILMGVSNLVVDALVDSFNEASNKILSSVPAFGKPFVQLRDYAEWLNNPSDQRTETRLDGGDKADIINEADKVLEQNFNPDGSPKTDVAGDMVNILIGQAVQTGLNNSTNATNIHGQLATSNNEVVIHNQPTNQEGISPDGNGGMNLNDGYDFTHPSQFDIGSNDPGVGSIITQITLGMNQQQIIDSPRQPIQTNLSANDLNGTLLGNVINHFNLSQKQKVTESFNILENKSGVPDKYKLMKYISKEGLQRLQTRYPGSDPRLAELNWKMDNMMGASNAYVNKQFPENVEQTSRVKKILARNIELSDPKTFKDPKQPMTYGKVFKPGNAKKYAKRNVVKKESNNLYTKALMHIDMNRVKELREEKIKEEKIAQILQEQQEILAELEYIEAEESKHVDWRRELNEAMTTAGLGVIYLDGSPDAISSGVDDYDSAESDASSLISGRVQMGVPEGQPFELNIEGSPHHQLRQAVFKFDSSRIDTLIINMSGIGGGAPFWADPNPLREPHVEYLIYQSSNPFGGIIDGRFNNGDNIVSLPRSFSVSDLEVYIYQYASDGEFSGGYNPPSYINSITTKRIRPMSLFVALDDPEANSFIRDGTVDKMTTAEKKKKLEEMLSASEEYLNKMFGSGMPKGATVISDVQAQQTFMDIRLANDIVQEPGLMQKGLDKKMDDAGPMAPMPIEKQPAGGNMPIVPSDYDPDDGTKIASARGPYGTPGADKPYTRKGYKDKDGKFVDFDNPATWPKIPKAQNRNSRLIAMVAHHEPEGEVISEKKRLKSPKSLADKIPGYYDGKPSPLGFPVEEPPKMKNGFHPDLVDGKKVANRFNRLDPISAKAMPPTGNPHIDKKVRAAAKKPK